MNGFDHEMQLEQEPMVDGQVQPHPHRPLSARPSVNRQHQETLIAEREVVVWEREGKLKGFINWENRSFFNILVIFLSIS